MAKRKGGKLNSNRNWLVLEDESKQNKDGSWTHKCGHDIKVCNVSHPIHDGPFPLSGSGRVHVEPTPYCPKCETIPNQSGSIIQAT